MTSDVVDIESGAWEDCNFGEKGGKGGGIAAPQKRGSL
jgi:hypothetical protein